jgi:hypothetical protein
MDSGPRASRTLGIEQSVPTSTVLRKLLDGADPQHVSIGWLIDSLEERSFGIVMLLLGLIALVPGASGVVGVLMAIPAVQMILARRAPVFPGFIARRQVSTPRLARLIARVQPVLLRLEKVIRPRWITPIEATKRVVGMVLLVLGGLLIVPFPLSNVIPALVIMLLAFAYLEDDGVLLCVALVAAAAALAIAVALVWGTIMGIDFIDPKSPGPG